LKQAQLFVQVSPNRFVPVDNPVPEVPMYVWDDEKKEIVPESDSVS
jgi:hypothetical protein